MTVVDTATGEIVSDLTVDEARTILGRIDARVEQTREDIHADVVTLWNGRAWLALGFESWHAMCDAKPILHLALPKPERVALVTDLREQGMSTRAIGSALGISQATAARAARESNDSPAPVVGLDGKTYTQPTPAPERLLTRWEEGVQADIRHGRSVALNMRGPLWLWAESVGLAVRIDRRSDWGNPFILPDDGDRDAVCDAYANAYWPHKTSLHGRIDELVGMALGCWCQPLRCHGDFLAGLANR